MRIVLKEFQEESVTKLVRYMRSAGRDARAGDLQAVCLSSTTGSGKTVMLTSAIELLLLGDDDNAPVSDATILWITDQPELNEQTRKKMIVTSTVLNAENLIVIDSSFDQETLPAGAVSFLNIQKLGKDKSLVTRGDLRTYSIWEIIENTILSRPAKFFVVIDEAHRGMGEDDNQAEAVTIIQKFIKGSPGEIPPVPVVVGISATPERFNQLITGTGRMNRPVDVNVEDVRKSGLIKDTIVLHHPTKEQPTDITMLREAARSLRRFTKGWASYCAAQEEFTVVPLLVVQVEDSPGKGQISETDIGAAINMLRAELGNLPSDAFGHSFQEGVTLQIGGEDIRYIAPSEIDADRDVRIVFFKASLNTGWDCPRAEVMMSFRAASDATNIAQLVGRMVRTPLARRIADDEMLNTVALYLPHYDKKHLEIVVAKLSKPDGGPIVIDVVDGEDIVDLSRAPGSERYFEALAASPSYVVPRQRKASQVRRLMKFARLLANDEIDSNAVGKAREKLLSVLDSEFESKKGTARFRELVDERGVIEVEAVNWDVGIEGIRVGDLVKVDLAGENVDDLFEATGRKLNEGLHKAWWRKRVNDAPDERDKVKLELFALCVDPDVTRKVENAAQGLVQQWMSVHRASIAHLEEASRALYDEIRNLAASPELTPLAYPAHIQGKKTGNAWEKHLYVDDHGEYKQAFRPKEAETIERELRSPDVKAWLRNVDRKSWALCVPYEVNGEQKAMYPDFLFVREVKGHLLVDIVEPHSIHLADAAAKAAGLARFAAKHADKFGRIELIMLDKESAKSVDFADEIVRKKFVGIKSADELRRLFEEL